MGPRLKLRRGQAEAGDIVLLSGDGSEALTHPYPAPAWAPRGADPRVAAPTAVTAPAVQLGHEG